MNATRADVNEFFSQRKLAIVGVSRNESKFGTIIYKTLKQKGYELYPVHPVAESILGDRCYRSLAAVPEKVGGLIVCVPPVQTEAVLHEALEAGIKRVWLQQGAESNAAVRFCEQHEIRCVQKQCVLMFAEPVGSFHLFHRWIWQLLGKMPAARAETHES